MSAETAADAAAAIAGPALRALIHGGMDRALAIISGFDDEAVGALGAAADRLAVACRDVTGRRA